MPDDERVPVRMQKADFTEIGTTGLDHTGGEVTEEFLTDLQGTKSVDVYQEMSHNDPIVGACLLAIKQMVKQADWTVKPGGDRLKDEKAAEFVEGAFEDLNQSWDQFISQALSMVTYGWSFNEIVYKRREGDVYDPREGSQFNDNRIGWKKFAPRSQDSLWRWEFAENGDVLAMVQRPEPDFVERTIPIEKSLLFRTSHAKGNPEGKSALRTAYRPWFFKKRLEEIEAIGIERDLAGIPVMYVPPRLLKEDADEEESSTRANIEKMLKDVRNDKAASLVIPALYNESGKKMFEFELLSSKGRRSHDTSAIIMRKNRAIAASMLADFILIGHENVGSFALASSKTHLFSVAVGAHLDEIAEVFNRWAIPELLRLNGKTSVAPPKLTHTDVETLDLDELAAYVTALTRDAKLDLTGEEIQGYLKDQAGMPENTPADAMEEEETTESDDTGG